jgi:hypothetical protein
VTLRRRYLVCPACGCGCHPRDGWLGLEGFLSPQARRLVCLAAASWSFDRASGLLEQLCGLRVSDTTICAAAVAALNVELAGQQRGLRSAGQRRALAELPDYLGRHVGHSGYRERLQRGQSIGSGMVEGARKTVVGKRLKQTGARWRVRHAERMVALCGLLYSDLWDQFGAPSANGPQNPLPHPRQASAIFPVGFVPPGAIYPHRQSFWGHRGPQPRSLLG